MRVAFLSTVYPIASWLEPMTRHAPEIELVSAAELGDGRGIAAALVWLPPAGALARLPDLRFVQALGAGADHILADPGLKPGVPVARLVDPYMTAAMSEHVQLQVLRLHRQDIAYQAQQAAREWRELAQPNATERKVGILGLGVLGSDAALRLKVLGFDVAGWSSSERRLRGIRCYPGRAGLAKLLQRSEILICLLPLTPATENILDARLFAALPRGAAIVNCGRGAHLVEEDLIPALESGQLSAAILDVFRTEPLAPEHPFWRHPRILVTPHAAAATNPATAAAIVADNLRRLAAGKPPEHLVDPSRGY